MPISEAACHFSMTATIWGIDVDEGEARFWPAAVGLAGLFISAASLTSEFEGPDAGSQPHEVSNETTVTNPTRRRKTEGKVMRIGVENADRQKGSLCDPTSRPSLCLRPSLNQAIRKRRITGSFYGSKNIAERLRLVCRPQMPGWATRILTSTNRVKAGCISFKLTSTEGSHSTPDW